MHVVFEKEIIQYAGGNNRLYGAMVTLVRNSNRRGYVTSALFHV